MKLRIARLRAFAETVHGETHYVIDEKDARQEVERDANRPYDAAALSRQQTMAFLAHYEPIRFAGLQKIRVPTAVLQGIEDPIRSVFDLPVL